MASVNPREIKVVVLTGGKGTRLRPLTAVFPKPLVPLGNRPILEILLLRLAAFGFRDITLCTGHLSELLMAVFGDGSKLGLSLTYSHEETPLGTAGPLALLNDLTDPFIVMNGDLLTTLKFPKMVQYHLDQGADVTIGLYPREVHIDFGVIERTKEGQFTGYVEKPTYQYEVSMGVNVLKPRVLEQVQAGSRMDMPDLVKKVHASGGRVCCYREDCFWLDIGRMDDYALAQEKFAENQEMLLRVDP